MPLFRKYLNTQTLSFVKSFYLSFISRQTGEAKKIGKGKTFLMKKVRKRQKNFFLGNFMF
jgi:hypothetical protein